MNYWLHPEARRDLRGAARFYRERAGSPMAQLYLAEFERTVDLLLRHPNLGAIWINGIRRFVMRRFPYAIIYRVADDQLRILAVAHHSRHPDYWRDRVEDNP